MLGEMTLKKVLFATDFSDNAELALNYAIELALHCKATLSLLHVVELSDPAMEAEMTSQRPCVTRLGAIERIESLAAKARAQGLVVETHVKNGIPFERILKAINSQRADMLVLGVCGVNKRLAHLLIGSNTENLLMHATCPTLTVGQYALGSLKTGRRAARLVYVSDFSPGAVAAARYAVLLGKAYEASIDVCQVMPKNAETDPVLRRQILDRYCRSLCRLVPNEYSAWCNTAFHLERTVAVDELERRCMAEQADMIVLGIRKRSLLGRHLHTSFAYRLLAGAPCPVLTVRDRDGQTGNRLGVEDDAAASDNSAVVEPSHTSLAQQSTSNGGR